MVKTYRRIVKYTYWAVVEREAESVEDFKETLDNMFNDEICGADMIPVSDLVFDDYGEVEEVTE